MAIPFVTFLFQLNGSVWGVEFNSSTFSMLWFSSLNDCDLESSENVVFL